MDFVTLAKGAGAEEMPNAFAARTAEGEWLPGFISVEFLQHNFGSCATLDECIAATNSQGLRRFFESLK